MDSNHVVAIVDCCAMTTAKLVTFGFFWDRFKSWSAPGSMTEVMTHSKFVFVVLSQVGWIHSWTQIMLLPLSIVAQ